ncbi:MAG: methyltransferase [Rhodospirillaceae bacterium]|nr:methyltransferase [Rhodospirillaceae bacterium]MBT5943626.1 methyltransferase [Rhodospirillaceae bacterium]MBT6404853.1 methyltransferase [Rhodospirillaceae bacterium]MBT6534680.1 methyltransferase [Rhodospirillaceae bacterium]MBT7360470.1 methyltransferase [Rhodospirillaceae bacterium]
MASQSTAVTDFYDDAQIADVYEPEVAAFLQQLTGAARVHIFDHTRRADSESMRSEKVVREPAGVIHNDYTQASAEKRVRDLFPADEAEDLLSRRFAIVNLWRSSNNAPIETAPLALCDARSVSDGDLITVERHSKDRIGEVQQVIFNPDHRWFYYPRLEADEALLIKTYDSATDGRARFSVHTAFEDPTVSADAPPRESIETRAFVFY